MKFLSDILATAGLVVDGVVTLNNTATGQTPDANDNSTKLATTAWVRTFVQPYSLPIASASVLGGIKVGNGLSIDAITGVLTASGGGSVGSFRSKQVFIATAGQTTFTISGGYRPEFIDVFLNGVYLNDDLYTATNSSTIVLDEAAAVDDIISVFIYSPYYVGESPSSRDICTFTATAGQTTFSCSYVIGAVDVYYNGSKLAGSEFNASNGTTVVLNTACDAGDFVEVISWVAGGGLSSSRTITIDGVTQDLTADRSWSVLPTGGAAGDILAKVSATNYDVTWIPNYTSSVQHIVKAAVELTKGQAVYISSADGTNMVVSKASNASEQTSSKTLGLVAQNLAINGQGFVITEGLLAGLDTSTAQAGDPVFLGTDGNLLFGLINKPYAPAHLVFIGFVTRVQQNNGEIFVHVQNGFELDELHDLSVRNPTDGDMIKYVASTGLWTKIAATTTNITEGTNLYYTNTRARAAISLTTSGTSGAATYDDTTGILNIPQYQGGVTSFNTRTGAITLSSSDVTTALGYTPVTNARTLTINGTTYDLSADRSWSIAAGVTSFNTRTGAISLTSLDVTDALTYTPVTNARTLSINGTTYDLTANRSWTVGVNPSAREIQTFTATANQTTFTITGGYVVGLVDVFINGVRLTASDFTATNGTTVVLTTGTGVNNIVDVIKYTSAYIIDNALRQTTYFTATAGQTTFTVSYSPGLVDVFYNGSKLPSSEYTAVNGTSIVLTTPAILNDTIEVTAYNYTVGAFTGQTQLNGTGFVKVSGTTVSYDNSTYLTTSSASSTYLPLTGGTLTGTLNGTSSNFSSNVTMGGNDSAATRLYVRTEDTANTPSLTLFKNITSESSEDIFRVQSWNGAFNTVASIRANGSATFGSTNGIVTVNRSSTSFASLFKMSTAGVENWSIGVPTLSSADWVLFNHATGISNLSFASSTGAATFSSSVTAADLIISDTYANDPLIKLASTTSGNAEVQIRTATTTYNPGIGVVTDGYDFSLFTNNTPRLTIASTGSATFNLGSGEMRLNRTGTSEFLKLNTYYLLTDGNDQLLGSVTGATYIYAGSGVSPKVTIDSTGAATFGSSITLQSNNALFVNNADNTRSGYLRTSNQGTELSSHNGAGEPLILIAPHSSATMRFYTAGSTNVNERMRITSDGNVLIGTNTSNGALLEVKQPTLAIASIFQAWAPGVAGANFRVISTTGQPYMQYDFNNGKMGVNLSDTLATLATLGGAVQFMGDYRNHQTIIKSAGTAGTFSGQLTITIPEMSSASSDGYGAYSCEVYVSGFPNHYCHVWFSGYINGGITVGEVTILRSNGGWSVSQSSFGANNQGFQFIINYPDTFIHPAARIIFNKGGSPNATEYPANNITAVFS